MKGKDMLSLRTFQEYLASPRQEGNLISAMSFPGDIDGKAWSSMCTRHD